MYVFAVNITSGLGKQSKFQMGLHHFPVAILVYYTASPTWRFQSELLICTKRIDKYLKFGITQRPKLVEVYVLHSSFRRLHFLGFIHRIFFISRQSK